MKKSQNIIALILIAVVCSLQSCKKETEDKDTSSAEYSTTSEKIFTDVLDIVDEAAEKGSVSKSANLSDGILTSSCATVSFDTLNNTKQITIDFGPTNCLCTDNVYRRGQILASYTGGRYRDSAMVKHITFNNYFANDNNVTGTKTVTNKGHNSKGNLEFSIQVDGTIELANGAGTLTWTCNRTREWIAGASTIQITDDIYSITGTSRGKKVNGTLYTTNITSPLVKDLSCSYRNFTKGSIEITPEGKQVRTINYGDGACDRIATVSIGKYTKTITTR